MTTITTTMFAKTQFSNLVFCLDNNNRNNNKSKFYTALRS